MKVSKTTRRVLMSALVLAGFNGRRDWSGVSRDDVSLCVSKYKFSGSFVHA